jgi:ADP-ribosylglycohydrolase
LWPRGGAHISLIEDQLAGLILGQALGDALGFVVEAKPAEIAREYVDNWLRTGRAGERSPDSFPFGQYTDDTQLARELLRSFVDAGGWSPVSFGERVALLFREGKDVGAGMGTRAAAHRLIAGESWQDAGTPAPYAGNGSAMRAAPLGILIPDCAAMCRATWEQSRVTHQDSRCAAGAVAIARGTALAAQRIPIITQEFLADLAHCAEPIDASVAEAVRDLGSWASLEPLMAARHLHEIGLDPGHQAEWHGISSFVTPSVVWSLYAFLRSPDDFWETICTAVGVGGDTDSMAAMAGAMSGARAGPQALPGALVAALNDRGEWDSAALTRLAQQAAAVSLLDRAPSP